MFTLYSEYLKGGIYKMAIIIDTTPTTDEYGTAFTRRKMNNLANIDALIEHYTRLAVVA